MGSYTKTIYYCDDCKQEVEGRAELREVVYELSGINGSIGKIQKQICEKCFEYYDKLYFEMKNMRKDDFILIL